MSAHGTLEPDIIAELGSLETEPRLVRQVNKLSRTPRIYVGGPSLPLDEQVRIVWRVPEPGPAPRA